MFTSRAVETSRSSFFARYRTIFFGLLIAAVAVIASNTMLAATHKPSKVSCVTTGDGTGESNYVANPTPSNLATLTITQQVSPDGATQEQCAWSGFGGSGTSVSGDNVELNFSIYPVNGYDCVAAGAYGWFGFKSTYPGFFRSFQNAQTEFSAEIPAGTNLSTLTLYGSVYVGGDESQSGCEMEMDLKSISAIF